MLLTRQVAGSALTAIVFIVASVTLGVTYNVAENVIHAASQRLAESMADTVSTRVSHIVSDTEAAVLALRVLSQTPSMYAPSNPSAGADWYQAWLYALAAITDQMDDLAWIAVLTDDGGLVAIGTWWANPQYLYEYALDPRTLVATGSSTVVGLSVRNKVTNVPWDAATQGPTFKPPFTGDVRSLPRPSDPSGDSASARLWLQPTSAATGWLDRDAVNDTLRDAAFTLTARVPLINVVTGSNSGEVMLSRYIAGIHDVLRQAETTSNTYTFIVSEDLRVVASSYGAPFENFAEVFPGTARRGCVTTPPLQGTPVMMGCHVRAADAGYPPLENLAVAGSAALNGRGISRIYGTFGTSEYYFFIGVRIQTTLGGTTLNLLLFMPESDVKGHVASALNTAMLLCFAIFAVALGFANMMVYAAFPRKLAMSTGASCSADFVAGDDLDDYEFPPGVDVGDGAGPSHSQSLSMRSSTGSAWLQLGSMTVCCSVLYADVVGFSALCDTVAQERLSDLLQRYFRRSASVVRGHGGLVDRFVGDCVMAVFGAPVAIERHETRAALCAKQLAHEMATLAALAAGSDGAGSGPGAARLAVEWSGVRTAVATGVVALEARTTAGAHGGGGGGGGGAARMPSTVVGDAVNHALTLLGLNRQWGTRTVISGETAEQCRDSLALRHLVTVATVGVEGRGDVFEVLGVRPDLRVGIFASTTSPSAVNFSLDDDTDDTMRPAAAAGMASHLFDARRHTCAALLRKAQSTLSAEPRQVEWARCYGAALAAFRNGDYAGCLEQLDAAAAARAPQSPETVSEQRLREVCAAVATYTSPIAFSAVWESSIGAFI